MTGLKQTDVFYILSAPPNVGVLAQAGGGFKLDPAANATPGPTYFTYALNNGPAQTQSFTVT